MRLELPIIEKETCGMHLLALSAQVEAQFKLNSKICHKEVDPKG